jgi:[protein-PII] uridylyltransferase
LASIIKQDVLNWRDALKSEQAATQSLFYQQHNTKQTLKSLSLSVDSLLIQVWQKFEIETELCLIAVGGYGREELFPYSDIDLLILLPYEASAALNEKIEGLVGALWDIGLNVGHSVRTLEECKREAKLDVTVLTNLLESRLLHGTKSNYKIFISEIKASIDAKQFYDDKLKEQTQRHAKFNDTAYNLEPNLKESPGGLRDLNMILWIAQSQSLGGNWRELALNGVITSKELHQIRRYELYLHSLRIRLHYLAKRREDRLLFDFQNDLAAQFDLVNTNKKRASEQLMQRYYRAVKFISLMNELLLKTMRARLNSSQENAIRPINERFSVQHDLLLTNAAHVFQQQPSAIFESFLLLQQHPEIKGFSASLIRELQRIRKFINRDFRLDSQNKKLFLEILSQPDGVNRSLRRMNNYGILGEYIPAFGKIIGQMQHDLFHVYTVDEHILNVLRNLRRFAKPELTHHFPLCSQLFADFEKPHLLYLAALFHDIAKGRGGDHSELGTKDARRFCKLHGLSKTDTELVSWLVEAHLKMSSTAQKSDLSDPEVINQFAQFTQNESRITALYLLTVADIRGTSPAVWNAWKAKLLENLYYRTRNILRTHARDAETQINLRKEAAYKKLKTFNLQPESVASLWESFGESYFIRYEEDEIAWQSRLLMRHQDTEKPIVRARLSPKGDGIQVLIYSKDRHDIFARICLFFGNLQYNIVHAKIFTTSHGYALDNFIILEQDTKQISYSGLLKYIEEELTLNLEQNNSLEAPAGGRLSRQVKHMPIKTEVKISQDHNSQFHQLDIVAHDKPGLLAKIAQKFLVCNIVIHNAKINTLGNRVEDSFLISGINQTPLNNDALQKIKTAFSEL